VDYIDKLVGRSDVNRHTKIRLLCNDNGQKMFSKRIPGLCRQQLVRHRVDGKEPQLRLKYLIDRYLKMSILSEQRYDKETLLV
jgi:hypothetical protein